MSTESLIDSELSVTSTESNKNTENTEDIKTDCTEDIKIDCTEKYSDLCRDLKAMEKNVSENKDFLKIKMDTIMKYEELLDKYHFEISKSEDPKLDDIIVLAESFMSMCRIKLPVDTIEHEYLYIGRFFVMQSMELLKDKELNRKVILLAMSTFNTLSNICIKLRNEELAFKYLQKSLNLYKTYTEGDDNFSAPIDILVSMDLSVATNTLYLLDKMYLETLRSLMILSYNMKHIPLDMRKVTTYMHKLLKKQLEDIPETVDYVVWSMEAIRLADYFLSCERFIECKNHLALASVIITKYHNDCCKIDAGISAEEKNAFYYRYKSTVSAIDACWVRYGLGLLFSSKKLLLEGRGNISKASDCKSESTAQSSQRSPNSAKQSTRLLMFPCAESEYKQFICINEEDYITRYDEAKMIFVNILQLLNKIKIDKFVSEDVDVRVEIAQYISRTYKYLAFYAHDTVSQIKLQKRRIDILEDCLKTLNKNDNATVCTVIWIELAFINSTILNIKLESACEIKPFDEKESAEIHQLAEKSKSYLQLYIDHNSVAQFALQNGLIDKSYQVISLLNIKYPLKNHSIQ